MCLTPVDDERSSAPHGDHGDGEQSEGEGGDGETGRGQRGLNLIRNISIPWVSENSKAREQIAC